MKIGDRDSCSDRSFDTEDASSTSEDEMDGRTLTEILSDSKKKKAALAATRKN